MSVSRNHHFTPLLLVAACLLSALFSACLDERVAEIARQQRVLEVGLVVRPRGEQRDERRAVTAGRALQQRLGMTVVRVPGYSPHAVAEFAVPRGAARGAHGLRAPAVPGTLPDQKKR